MSNRLTPEPPRRKFYFILLLLVCTALALLALLYPYLSTASQPTPKPGDVADRDYRASGSVSFESQVLTEQRRESAAKAVSAIYTLPDTRVARQQLERLRAVLAYIQSIRSDIYADPQRKLDDLAALEDVHLAQEAALAILGLTDARWQEVQQEAISILEKAMSSPIRPEEVQSARNSLPAMVSLALTEAQAGLVVDLVSPFVDSNSEYSETLTEAAREQARQEATPVIRVFASGQTVVPRGQVFTEADIEALSQMGLIESQQNWKDLLSAAVLALLLVTFMLLYLRRERPALARDARNLTLIAQLFLATLWVARLAIPFHVIIPYVFPLATYGLTVTALFGAPVAIISSLPLAILVAYGLPNSLDLTFFYLLTSLFGILALGRARRVSSFFWAGAAIAVAGAATVLVYRLPLPTTDIIGLATLAGAAVFNGVAAASLTVLLQFALAQLLGMITPMQLVDLTRPDHPLLQRLLRDAPGTYQHSLQVANLAEQAAERIGADALLTRVGALYHDVGKTVNPVYFIENQLPGFPNPHRELQPAESAQIIIRHVTDGLEVGKKYRLPRRVIEFMSEHHGSMITSYQYYEAVKAANGEENQVDEEIFRYPGPRPQSRETAILMLADGAEARVRAEKPADEKEMAQVIREMINDRMDKGQLDDTRLTLRDLSLISESFTTTLRGVYHPRIQYPKLESKPALEIPTIPVPRLAAPPNGPADQEAPTLPTGRKKDYPASEASPASPLPEAEKGEA